MRILSVEVIKRILGFTAPIGLVAEQTEQGAVDETPWPHSVSLPPLPERISDYQELQDCQWEVEAASVAGRQVAHLQSSHGPWWYTSDRASRRAPPLITPPSRFRP